MNENESFEKNGMVPTIVSVRKNEVVIAGDGQVTLGDAVMKSNAKKVRSLASGKVITGFVQQLQMLSLCLRD